MTLGSHLTPLARRHIETADVVFTATSDGVIELWLQKMHRDVRSLQPFYQEGRSRAHTYRAMVEAIMEEVRAGKRVCGAFYGHPGVFATVAHNAIEAARTEGFDALMEPGISAADCLYADLAIDPGRVGCQHFEATQFLMFQRRIDPTAYLVLWQVGVAGDVSLKRFATTAAHRQVLVDVLLRDYAADHEVVLYEAATLPTHRARVARFKLRELPNVEVSMHATLVVPPNGAMAPDLAIRERLAALDSTNKENT